MSSESSSQFFCFPIHGLQCEDADHPGVFLFTDATILSGQQARLLYTKQDDYLPAILHDNTYYLVVWRPGSEQYKELDDHFAVVLERAKEIMAGISIPLLAYSNFSSMPSLISELHSSPPNSMVHLHAKTLTSKEEQIPALPIFPSEYRFTRQHLLDLLNREPYRWLSKAVLFTEGDPTPLQLSIRKSAASLYIGINQPSPTFQFFGCYVALEVLMFFGVSALTMKRSELLVGSEIYQDFHASKVVKEDAKGRAEDPPLSLDKVRNKIVHEGGSATAENVFYAVRFVTNVLLAVAHQSQRFEVKQQLCEHLNFVLTMKGGLETRDLFSAQTQWKAMWSENCLWNYQFASLVYFFGLYKTELEDDAFLLNTAAALAVLVEKKKMKPLGAFRGLQNAMYARPMPFNHSIEAWEYLTAHRSAIAPSLEWFKSS